MEIFSFFWGGSFPKAANASGVFDSKRPSLHVAFLFHGGLFSLPYSEQCFLFPLWL